MTAHFLDLLGELKRRSLRMATLVEDIVEEACEASCTANSNLASRVMGRDKDVDSEEIEVEREVIRLLALYQPVGSDLRLLCTVLKINSDLERISDCAVNISERTCHLVPDVLIETGPELQRLGSAVRSLLRRAIQAYADQDANAASSMLKDDAPIDALYSQMIRATIAANPQAPSELAAHLDILSIAKNLERIADHATNLAEDVIYLATGNIVRHRTE